MIRPSRSFTACCSPLMVARLAPSAPGELVCVELLCKKWWLQERRAEEASAGAQPAAPLDSS